MKHPVRKPLSSWRGWAALFVVAALLVGGLFWALRPRLMPYLSILRARVKYALAPPQQAVFVPQDQVARIVEATLRAYTATAQARPTLTPTPTPSPPGPTATPVPTFTPTVTPTPLPAQVYLKGVRHEYQEWNNCGPATLSMALSYWGWKGWQTTVAEVVKPNPRDKNVSPYELENFVTEHTPYGFVWRMGGDLALLKRFLASGFPVVVEKGFTGHGFEGWMGHYELLVGYDDAKGQFIAFDSFRGPDYPVPYDQLREEWRAFNYLFWLVYPEDREHEVQALLGPWADETWANRHALAVAQQETQTLTGRPLFFAWFNVGTSHVRLREYVDAAYAYDMAFTIYAQLPQEERPWRMLWYQTGPYWAYYYSGRYQDVINLATTTLAAMSEPILEESYYWRGLAKAALGDKAGAIADLEESVRLNPHFRPGLYQLSVLKGTGP